MKDNHVMTRKYYGQEGDDFLIWSLFPPGLTGYYVDVGAFDGIHLSNSYSFEQAGWQGICVEANRDYYPLLVKNRPACHAIDAACVSDPSLHEVVFLSEPLGLLSGIEAHKTQNMDRRYAARGMTFPGWSEITVPAKTLTHILDEAGAPQNIEFLSIDVEGTELDVLLGIDFSRYSFRLIISESNTSDDEKSIGRFLASKGYFSCRKLGVNTFYVRSPRDGDIIASARGSITIEDTLHPLGEQATRVETRGRTIVI